MDLPCGSCVGCRRSRARAWAIRCSLELQDHVSSCVVTLTYDDAHLPPTLQRLHVSEFMRSLRKRLHRGIPRKERIPLRFFACGEYGERTWRPHYHAILYGTKDEQMIRESWGRTHGRRGRSDYALESFGHVKVDEASPEAIAYIAGYVAKKMDVDVDDLRSERVDMRTGELYVYQPPFLQMSLKPGIGASARKHWRSWSRHAVHEGHEVPVPRYYYEAWREQASLKLKLRRHHELLPEIMRRREESWEEWRERLERLRDGELIEKSRTKLSHDRRKL